MRPPVWRAALLLPALTWASPLTPDHGPAPPQKEGYEDVVSGRRGNETVEVGHHLCPRGIGAALDWPNVQQHLSGPSPRVYKYALPLSLLGAAATAAISFVHMRRLSRPDGYGKEALKVRVIAMVPLVVAVSKCMSVWAPRSWKLLFLLGAIYEVVVFKFFLDLILGFLGRTDKEVLEKFAEAPAAKIWAVPPLACCCKPCTSPRRFLPQDLRAIRLLLQQFMVVLPMVAALEMSESVPHAVHEALGKVETLSLVTAMYGLFALLEATHEPLHERRCHAKFWTIKGTFIASTAIFRIFCGVVLEDVRVGRDCYTSETLAAAWASMITALVAAPLALLSCYAYVEEDAEAFSSETEEVSFGSDADAVPGKLL